MKKIPFGQLARYTGYDPGVIMGLIKREVIHPKVYLTPLGATLYQVIRVFKRSGRTYKEGVRVLIHLQQRDWKDGDGDPITSWKHYLRMAAKSMEGELDKHSVESDPLSKVDVNERKRKYGMTGELTSRSDS